MEEDYFVVEEEENEEEEEKKQNRTFIILVAALGGLLVLGICAFIVWAVFINPRMRESLEAQNQAIQATNTAVETTKTAMAMIRDFIGPINLIRLNSHISQHQKMKKKSLMKYLKA